MKNVRYCEALHVHENILRELLRKYLLQSVWISRNSLYVWIIAKRILYEKYLYSIVHENPCNSERVNLFFIRYSTSTSFLCLLLCFYLSCSSFLPLHLSFFRCIFLSILQTNRWLWKERKLSCVPWHRSKVFKCYVARFVDCIVRVDVSWCSEWQFASVWWIFLGKTTVCIEAIYTYHILT